MAAILEAVPASEEPTLASIAQALNEEHDGDREATAAALYDRLCAEVPGEPSPLLAEALRVAANEEVRGVASHERLALRRLPTAERTPPPATIAPSAPLQTPGQREHQRRADDRVTESLVNGAMFGWMLYRLPSGAALGLATKAAVLTAAAEYRRNAVGNLRSYRWLLLIAREMDDKRTVADSLTPQRLEELHALAERESVERAGD